MKQNVNIENLREIENVMKQESLNRNKIFEDVEKNLQAHSQKLVEYDRAKRAYELLEVKYSALKKEYTQSEEMKNKRIESLKSTLENVDHENKILKKMVMAQKRKISGLQSIVELVVNDYGIQNIELVTGLSSDKIKEYFQD